MEVCWERLPSRLLSRSRRLEVLGKGETAMDGGMKTVNAETLHFGLCA